MALGRIGCFESAMVKKQDQRRQPGAEREQCKSHQEQYKWLMETVFMASKAVDVDQESAMVNRKGDNGMPLK